MKSDVSKVDRLKKIINSDKIEPYIRSIVFTNFKNIESNQKITFDYPITALVGPNGTNKTSALVALYGTVAGKTPAEYWFTTPLDYTKNNPNKNDAYQSYYYTYREKKYIAEVLQINNQRVSRSMDYWETDKPKKNLGMNVDLSGIVSDKITPTRWKKIEKNVVYINFRSELSSFDRCLYHANKPSRYFRTKQDYIRDKSKYLKKAIALGCKEFELYGKNRIISNKKLTSKEVQDVSFILNKLYSDIQYVEHTFFDVRGGTAFIKCNELSYSEAYAGSGEYAIVSLVSKITAAPKNSLILLDEPEVSLHPEAQKKLVDFLKRKIIECQHQVVISTHSPEIVESLPDSAIKLFMENPATNKIIINNETNKLNVFHTIGKKFNKTPIYVEDRLAKAILDRVIEDVNNLKNNFEVLYIPGGSSSMSLLLSALSEAKHKQLVLFDGDQKSSDYESEKKFPVSEDILDKNLDSTIEGLGFKLMNFKDSNSNSFLQQRNFIDSLNKYVTYLPFDSPELFLLNENDICNGFLSNKDAKELIKKEAKRKYGENHADSERIFSLQLEMLNKINSDCIAFEKIRNLLAFYLKNNTLRGWEEDYDKLFGG
ncbi:TPA: AAA family ATPase [Morganella morganii]|nr:AAA family ATPase [Morganella morganii]